MVSKKIIYINIIKIIMFFCSVNCFYVFIIYCVIRSVIYYLHNCTKNIFFVNMNYQFIKIYRLNSLLITMEELKMYYC